MVLTSSDLKRLFIEFFTEKGHKVVPNASLIPENDPTVLFTTAGMHPLVPYLMGQPHALGKRLVNFQKCLRTDDIDEVGDGFHHSFFEMLGNWSLELFKNESYLGFRVPDRKAGYRQKSCRHVSRATRVPKDEKRKVRNRLES
jgi:alanyl-tRNA synthetase